MDIRPITNDAEHADAVREIDALLTTEPDARSGPELDAMPTLVEAYERKRWPQDGSLDPIDRLKFTMAEIGRTRAELVQIVGSASRVSEVLGRRRPLTLEMIRSISVTWGIPLELLARPYVLVDKPGRPASVRRTSQG